MSLKSSKFTFTRITTASVVFSSLLLFLKSTTICIASSTSISNPSLNTPPKFGRISKDKYILTPQQIQEFHQNGCCTLPNVLTESEVSSIEQIFNQFLNQKIHVPGKDFCDMSKPFNTPFEEWSIVNCMLPTKYYPPFCNNVYEKLTACLAEQLFPKSDMIKDYDQFLNKRTGKEDAVFSWHQDMAYWPGPKALGVDVTHTATFSLAIDDSDEINGCLRYVLGSHSDQQIRPHVPLHGDSREDGHALTVEVDEEREDIRMATAKRGSVTIHNEYVVHGSGGNRSQNRQRRTYVIAYRAKKVVDAERRIGFTHSHNDKVNWDSFEDGEDHRIRNN